MMDLLVEVQRFWRNLLHLPRVAELAMTVRPGSTPSDVVLRRGRFSLLRYRRTSPATWAEPVLFCYALINRPYILDLLPGRSVVERYLQQGFEVYLIDWGTPTDADHTVTLQDHVCGFLKEAVDHIVREHRRDDLHLLGYCMGGTMSTLFAALHPASVRSLTLLAAPIDFSDRERILNVWVDGEYFDVDAFVARHGNCPASFLQMCFLLMKPVQNLVEKGFSFYDQMDDADAMTCHFAMERWNNDNIPVPGETFRQFVKDLYQANALVRGELRLGDSRVDLARIACPLLLLTAANDHLVPPASTEGIRPHVSSRDIRSITVSAGHVGLIVGGKARERVWPEATRWLADHSTDTRGPSASREERATNVRM